MIANSWTSTKLKASKSSRDSEGVRLLDAEEKIKNCDTASEGDTERSSHLSGRNSSNQSVTYTREKSDFSKFKSRLRNRDEYRMGRGCPSDRRGSSRGRGGTHRRSERDMEPGYFSRAKFHEPLNKGKTCNSNSMGGSTCAAKHNDSDNTKSKTGEFGGMINLPEDSRISKILRRLQREEDPEKFLSVVSTLQEAFMSQDNVRYIQKSKEMLFESLLDMLHYGPGLEAKLQTAIALGCLAYALDSDYPKFLEWLLRSYDEERNDDVRRLLMYGFYEVVRLDADQLKLKQFGYDSVMVIQHCMENTDLAEPLLVLIDTILIIMNLYPDEFVKVFRDVVDILLGWQLDSNQPLHLTLHIANTLHRMLQFWIADVSFAVSLLKDFTEDIRNDNTISIYCSDDKSKSEEQSDDNWNEACTKLANYIGLFNTVCRILGQHLNPAISSCVPANFLTDCFQFLMDLMRNALDGKPHDKLIVAGNGNAWQLLAILQAKTCTAHEVLYEIIDFELANADELSDTGLASTFQLVAKAVKEIGANLPLKLVQALLGPESVLLRYRFSISPIVHDGAVAVYRSLLSLKNIPLLKEAYRYFLGDLEVAYKVLIDDVPPLCNGTENPHSDSVYTRCQAHYVVLMQLKALSDIANESNSIIGMWVLQPSILELLAVKMMPKSCTSLSPDLQYALFYMLYSHCSRHNHFISSSGLIAAVHGRPNVCDIFGLPLGSDVTHNSPTSGHLSIVLNLLSSTLTQDVCSESKHLLLKWSCELLSQASMFLGTLSTTPEMSQLMEALCDVATSVDPAVSLMACASLEHLLTLPTHLFWKKDKLTSIVEVCAMQVNSTDSEVCARYSNILAKLPWTLVIPGISMAVMRYKSPCWKIIAAERSHITRGTNGEMQTHQFKQFIGYLLQGQNQTDGVQWLQEVFSICWSVCEPGSEVRDLAYCNMNMLLLWAVWEAAQLCISCKLRTPLGKPLDTFMAFEGAIKGLARETVHKGGAGNGSSCSGDDGVAVPQTYDLRRVRLLIELIEQLEKTMYNAADGTATALISPPKPVRTFFHTNKSTCAEWLARIRMAVVVVSLHSGMASSAVRNGHCQLQDLFDAGNTQGPEFENAILHVAWGLAKLKETEAIQGLYVWCRDTIGCKFGFLKPLAEHAASRYELAAEIYQKLINNEILDSPMKQLSSTSTSDDHTKNFSANIVHTLKTFVSDQITDCYLSLCDWNQLLKWKEKEAEILRTENNSMSPRYRYMSVNNIKALLEFEKGDLMAAKQLLEWDCPEKCSEGTWNCYQLLGETKTTLSNIAIEIAAAGPDTAIKESCRKQIESCRAIASTCLAEGLRSTPSEILEESALLQFAANALLDNSLDNLKLNEKEKQKTMCSGLRSQVLWWSNALEVIQGRKQPSLELSLELARTARKEGNLTLASRQLVGQLKGMLGGMLGETNGICGPPTLSHIARSIIHELQAASLVWNTHKASVLSEIAKLLYSVGDRDSALEVCTVVILNMGGSQNKAFTGLKESCARLLLTLSKWYSSSEVLVQSLPLNKLLAWEESVSQNVDTSLIDITQCDLSTSSTIPELDSIVGRLLRLSVLHCPGLDKAWSQLANWSYRWGRRVLDKTEHVLSPADRQAIDQLIPAGINQEKVYCILTRNRPTTDEEDIEAENMNTSEMVEWQLQSLGTFSPEQLAGLVEKWRQSHARVYTYYQLSAYSYFKYLHLLDSDSCELGSGSVTATLRLLRLIVKHALELQNVLETGLAHTPTAPWVSIIPQLFSRLSHPQSYVRWRVSELLCRLATDAPYLITFPAVVGSDAGAATIRDMPQTKLFRSCLHESPEGDGDLDVEDQEEEEDEDDDEEEEEELDNGDENQAVLENCFLAMVDTLAKQDPEAISQVRVLVRELRRITLLWDELWLGTLTQHHADMSRRITQLESEIARVDNNPHLSQSEKDRLVAEKHRIILKPLLFVLEQLHAITSVTPETPHEQWFQTKFGECIEQALERLAHPKDPRRPNDAWSALKNLQFKLQSRASKRTSYALRMTDISPSLAQLNDTKIAMPGVENKITISALNNHIAVLPTKTKPKKLVFHGSDGVMYTYLFKGLEDLHLDERIMQFLCIANTMLRSGSPNTCSSIYRARHYSVIPLGPRSGLISWVDNVTPLFALYKRWQQREAAISQTSSVMRPSEQFYSKLTPLLKECGVTNLDNRKEWPLPILKQVLMELMQETPTYLLSKELWCHSVNAGSWWQSTKLYSTSLAVMSIIGYIIGLGDRHLDNVLVDLATGEVVHIDYNVCFDKGKTLRVPEKVPFRLTPNLRAALGVTGVEGIFRLACEHVLKVMKKGRETLLTLLEAFVYDPLIDWTPGNETGYTGAVYGGGRALALETKQSRKQLEREVTCSMFAVRIAEIKHEWLENRDNLLDELPRLMSLLEKWVVEQSEMKSAEDCLQERHQQMALLKEAEAHPQHSLYSLPTRYAAHMTATDATNKARTGVADKIEECERQLAQYKLAVGCLSGPQLGQWLSEVNARPKKESYCNVFDLIKEFLQNAGQREMVMQCVQCENDVGELCVQQTQLTAACLELLGQYGAITRQYPLSYLKTHRYTLYRDWSRSLLELMTLKRCEEVLDEMKEALSAPSLNSPQSQQIISYSIGLHRLLNEARTALNKCIERQNSAPKETSLLESELAVERIVEKNRHAAELVIITALCGLNKRFLMMEAAAASAGDCLVDLTSREGDWFLDDMYVTTGSIAKLISILGPPSDARLKLAVQCVTMAHNQYKSLQELNVNFTSIILPEALQIIQREEDSAINLINEFNNVINSCPCSLQDLLAQLHLHMHFVIMGMDSPHGKCVNIVKDLRAGFEPLVTSPETPDAMSPGLMLFMGFNGLFENLAIGTNNLISALSTLNTPTAWKTVDQVREAKALSARVFDAEPRAVLEDIFLVKRLQTMQELFILCSSCGNGFKGGANAPLVPHDDERLNRTIRSFTADYLSHQLLGVFSHTLALTLCILLENTGFNITGEVEQRDIGAESRVPLDELCRKGVDAAIKLGLVSNASLSQATGGISALEAAWRRTEIAARLACETQRAEQTVQRLQLQFTAHHWLHEDTLALAIHATPTPTPTPLPPIIRSALMMELRKASTALIAVQPQLNDMCQQQGTLVTSAEQRLKWAAGANPALNEVMSAFESCVLSGNERLADEQHLANIVGNMCSTVLIHEALRTRTSESLSNDAAFVQLVEQCEKCCYLSVNLNIQLSSLEEGLVRLLPPPASHIDWAWINEAEEIISESVSNLAQKMELQQMAVFTVQDTIKTKANVVRSLLATHHRIMFDVRSLLKTMLKFEDSKLEGLHDYILRYKAYAERLSTLTKDLLSDEEFTPDRIHTALNEIAIIGEETLSGGIYEELLTFSVDNNNGINKRPPLLRQESVCVSPKKTIPRDPHTGKAVQERNAYALSVWRRVRLKLEGRDPDPGHRCTVQEQVDWTINEATSLENLALLYEGWTPWV